MKWFGVQETDSTGTPLRKTLDNGGPCLDDVIDMAVRNYFRFDVITIEFGENERTCERVHFDQLENGTLQTSISKYGTANYDNLSLFED